MIIVVKEMCCVEFGTICWYFPRRPFSGVDYSPLNISMLNSVSRHEIILARERIVERVNAAISQVCLFVHILRPVLIQNKQTRKLKLMNFVFFRFDFLSIAAVFQSQILFALVPFEAITFFAPFFFQTFISFLFLDLNF